ncbi:MAG: hypothetical protein LC770_11085 [Acidobacteria bacterium]|nr:hypothetical protein [Acidobacteriota bacterium]
MDEVSQARIISSIPGRVRLKVSRRGGMLESMQQIADALSKRVEVSDVQLNPQTGSILVRYDPERGSLDDLRSGLRQIGITINEVRPIGTGSTSGGETSEASANLTRLLGDLNARIGRATNGLGDLRLFVPLGLGALTVRQIFRHGLKLDDLPWYVTMWYAYQSFITLNPTTHQPAQAADRAASIPGIAESGDYDN